MQITRRQLLQAAISAPIAAAIAPLAAVPAPLSPFVLTFHGVEWVSDQYAYQNAVVALDEAFKRRMMRLLNEDLLTEGRGKLRQ